MINRVEQQLSLVHARLRLCRKCPNMCGQAVHGPALDTRIMIVGQAPGVHEADLGRPFAYTAGKTLFKWLLDATGFSEADIRETVYFSAVARCFPGKAKSGSGDRPPDRTEALNCRENLVDEVAALRPKLVLAVGRSAIAEVLGQQLFSSTQRLADVVGKKFCVDFHGYPVEVICLPHPSGVSRWPQTEPGKSKLAGAIKLLKDEFVRYL